MTIVFLCRLFYPHIGGVEKHVREVGKRLVKQGHRLIVITELSEFEDASKERFRTKSGMTKNFENLDGMEVYRIPVGIDEKGKKWVIWRWMWEHRQIWQEADLVHCHDVFFWYLPFRLLYPGKKVYMTFHGYESYPIRWQAVVIRKIAEKLSWGNICIGDFMKKWYGTKPTYVSYGGVEIKGEGETRLQARQGVKGKGESALFYGRLDDQTGILTYQAAIHIINKKYPQFALTVLGDGELSNKIDRKTKRFGFQENVTEYLENSRYIFVSRYLSILEALAAKRLVFAVYDNPLKEDYLKMAAFAPYIVIEKQTEKLAEKVLFFLQNPKIEKELVEKGYEWVKGQTWEEVVRTYEKLWDMR